MRIFSRLMSDKTRAARANLRAARQHLADVNDADYGAGIYDETDEFLEANERVIEAEKPLAWWKRWDIDHTIA